MITFHSCKCIIYKNNLNPFKHRFKRPNKFNLDFEVVFYFFSAWYNRAFYRWLGLSGRIVQPVQY